VRHHLLRALALVGVAAALGATVFKESIATAADSISATITGPLDAQGNVSVHERGTANVTVTNRDPIAVKALGRTSVQLAGTVNTTSAQTTVTVLDAKKFCGHDGQNLYAPFTQPIALGYSAIRVEYYGQATDVELHDGGSDAPVFDNLGTPNDGRVSRIYQVPPPVISITCPPAQAQYNDAGTLTIYGWR
jgi:hypothetical protein